METGSHISSLVTGNRHGSVFDRGMLQRMWSFKHYWDIVYICAICLRRNLDCSTLFNLFFIDELA